jgi:hypothetical protein
MQAHEAPIYQSYGLPCPLLEVAFGQIWRTRKSCPASTREECAHTFNHPGYTRSTRRPGLRFRAGRRFGIRSQFPDDERSLGPARDDEGAKENAPVLVGSVFLRRVGRKKAFGEWFGAGRRLTTSCGDRNSRGSRTPSAATRCRASPAPESRQESRQVRYPRSCPFTGPSRLHASPDAHRVRCGLPRRHPAY